MPNREDRTKENYEQANDWHIEKSLAHTWLPQIERFVTKLTPNARILEVGAGGSGRDTQEFIKRGFAIDALDYSKAAVVSLRSRFPDITVHQADMRKIELPDESYDGIWACAAIVNLSKSEVPSILSDFYRLLREQGVIFVSAKEGEGEKIVPDKAGERFFNFFQETELRKLIEQAGFRVWHSEVTIGLVGARWVCIYGVK